MDSEYTEEDANGFGEGAGPSPADAEWGAVNLTAHLTHTANFNQCRKSDVASLAVATGSERVAKQGR
jgi:hypothetical protein